MSGRSLLMAITMETSGRDRLRVSSRGVKHFSLLTSLSFRGRWFVLIRCDSSQLGQAGDRGRGRGGSLTSSAERQITAAVPIAATLPHVRGLTSEHHRGPPAGSCRPKMLPLVIGHLHPECIAFPPSIRMLALGEILQDI